MYNKLTVKFSLIGLVILLSIGCSYIQHYQQQSKLVHIQNNYSLSTLDKVVEYTSQAPFHKIYEFKFKNFQDKPYALVFYVSESSFSKSIIKHRNANNLHHDVIRIDNSKSLLAKLNKCLPSPDSIVWKNVSSQITVNEARDGYLMLQDYIRLKIRDI